MYLDLRGDLAQRTKTEHERSVEVSEGVPWSRDKIVRKVASLDARRFLAWYREREHRGRTPAPATVNKVLRECRRIFREAVECSLIRENPFDGIRQEKVGQRPWHYVSPAACRQLIEVSPSLRWRGMIMLGYCCGLRLGEVVNLTWSDVDFEKTSGASSVQGGIAVQQVAWTPKDKDTRTVPLPDDGSKCSGRVAALCG